MDESDSFGGHAGKPSHLTSDTSSFNVDIYSIDQLLQDEELFVDFSPEEVPKSSADR